MSRAQQPTLFYQDRGRRLPLKEVHVDLTLAHYCANLEPLKGGEFLRKLHSLARRKSMSYLFVPAKGKGSHGKVYLGTASTIVKDRNKELGTGLLHQMCKDLGVDPEDL